jgi:hypothetical protein
MSPSQREFDLRLVFSVPFDSWFTIKLLACHARFALLLHRFQGNSFRYVAMGDPNSNLQESPLSSPAMGMNSKIASPSPVPSNVVFIDEIPIDFEVPSQLQQHQHFQPSQQQHQHFQPSQHQHQHAQQQQQQQNASSGSPIAPASKKPKCLGAPRCSLM